MKKKLILVALVAVITTGSAFADYPKGWGVGLVAGYGGHWDNGYYNSNWALSLKVPSMPIFWAIDFEVWDGYVTLGLRGDYYIAHRALIPEIKLDWYLGIGGWLSLGLPSQGNAYISFGARVPVGLSWQPVDVFELFLEIAPSLGFQMSPRVHFPYGGWGAGIGFRIWF
jgi:hypothetical protein